MANCHIFLDTARSTRKIETLIKPICVREWMVLLCAFRGGAVEILGERSREVRGGTNINVLPNRARDGIAMLTAMAIDTVRRISYLGEEDWRPDESDAMDPRQTRQQP